MSHKELLTGLYDHPLCEATHRALASQLQELHDLELLDPAEAPQRLRRYLSQFSETALASIPEAQRQQKQLALVNQIVALHHASCRDCEAIASFDDRGFAHRIRQLNLPPRVMVP